MRVSVPNGIPMFSNSSDNFRRDPVTGCRTVSEYTLSTRVYPLDGPLGFAEKEYQKSRLPIHLDSHLLIAYSVSDTGLNCRDRERKDLFQ